MTVRDARPTEVRIKHGSWYVFGKTYLDAVHMVVMAAPGSGKDQAGILPMLAAQLSHGDEHLVMVDPKGELRELLYPYLRADDRVFLYSFSPATDLSSALDPASDDEEMANVAAQLMPLSKGDSRHFDQGARRLAAEVRAGLGRDLGRGPSLVELYDVMEDPDVFDDLCERHSIRRRITTNGDEWGSTVSTARTHLEELRWGRVRRVFDSGPGVEAPFVGGGRTVVFVEPDEDAGERLEKYVALLVDRLYHMAARDGDPRGRGGKRGTKFVVDEAASYMKLEKIPQYLDIGRGKKVQLAYVLQNWPQLKDVLGRDKAERALSSTELRIAGAGASRETAEQVSKLTGERRVTFLGPRQRNWERRREQLVRPVLKPHHITGLRKDAEYSEWALTHGPNAELIRVRKQTQFFFARALPADPRWEYMVPLGLPRDEPGDVEDPPGGDFPGGDTPDGDPPDDGPNDAPGTPADLPPAATVTDISEGRGYRRPPKRRPKRRPEAGDGRGRRGGPADELEGPPGFGPADEGVDNSG